MKNNFLFVIILIEPLPVRGNTIALNIDRIVTNGVSNDMFTLLVRIFLV